ncbi:MAG TPA: ROK family protein [Bryobacteraceae bacterium]|nr:ROK family protein [Bryobacteraceae bacterium]
MNSTTTLSLDNGSNSAESSAPVRASRMREANVANLLRLLRAHSPCSRADLVRLSGLTAPTVSAGIRNLQRRDLATSLGQGSSSGGRPPDLLEFNARHGYVVGADIGGTNLRLALADLNGTIIGRWASLLRAERSPKVITDMIASGITHLSQQQKVLPKKILQIAAGAPGVTDTTAGRVLSAPNLTGWQDVPFRDLLESKTGIATTVENDVNLGALGEGWQGAARNVADFIFLAIGTGIGAGIVVNRVLHHGANWSAGEIGYMMLPGLSDEPPTTDQPGALESAIGGATIERAWTAPAGSAALRATDIFDLAAAGDRQARELLHRTAAQLAMAITNLSLVLDLSLVVLSGGVGGHPSLLEAIQRRLERNQFARPRLVTSSLGGEAQLHGAVWLALQAAGLRGFRRATPEVKSKRSPALVKVS